MTQFNVPRLSKTRTNVVLRTMTHTVTSYTVTPTNTDADGNPVTTNYKWYVPVYSPNLSRGRAVRIKAISANISSGPGDGTNIMIVQSDIDPARTPESGVLVLGTGWTNSGQIVATSNIISPSDAYQSNGACSITSDNIINPDSYLSLTFYSTSDPGKVDITLRYEEL